MASNIGTLDIKYLKTTKETNCVKSDRPRMY